MQPIREFPVLPGHGVRAVPWAMVLPHRAAAGRNHGQTLERLADRGGLSPRELLLVLDDARWPGPPEYVDQVAAVVELVRRVGEWLRALGNDTSGAAIPARPSPDKDEGAVLAAQEAARRGCEPGAVHRHYKGRDYAVMAPAVIEATLEPAVVYFGSRCGDVPWVRTLADWDFPVAGRPRFRPAAPAENPTVDPTALRNLRDRLAATLSAVETQLVKLEAASP